MNKISPTNDALKDAVKGFRERVDAALDRHLPSANIHPERLHTAMRYAVFNGGKRVRPVLAYAGAAALGCAPEAADGPACAVELIHAYSLVHDDLPAMDNDDLRRGKPTCHRAFDEATAILTGDALQALAFYILAHDASMVVEQGTRLRMIETLSQAAGSRGMAGGQAIDLAAVGRELDIVELEDMHIHKTGALIRASVVLGALCAPHGEDGDLKRLERYAACIGLAFQIRDDILDVESSTEELGKTQGADAALGKPTYPSLLGVAGAKRRANELHEEALEAISVFGPQADILRWLSDYVVNRSN